MTVSIWQAEGTQPVREVDVLIVGAGLVGCAAAVFATEAGHQVTITEMRDAGLGASSRNAGFMITGPNSFYHRAIEDYGHERARELWKLSEKTHAYWRRFAQEDGNVRLDECGSTLLAESPEEAKELQATVRTLNADDIEAIYHDTDPLRRGYHAAVEQPWDAAVQPYELVQAALRRSGAELVDNNELYAFEQTAPDCVTVYTRQFVFQARYVLLCTNAYSPQIDPYFVGKVVPTRAQCLVTEPLKNGSVLNTCGYSDYGYMYYRDTFDGRLLIGGGRKLHRALENDTTEDRITDPVQAALDAYLREKFPDVDVPVARRWSGIMGFTPDSIPLVGTLPGRSRVGFAVGFTGHGLAFGSGTAERAVDLLLNGTHPGVLDAGRLD